MSRRKFRVAATAISVLAFGAMASVTTIGLTSCQQQEEPPVVKDPVLTGVSAVTITNKSELQETPWYALTSNRIISLQFTGGEVNVSEALNSGALEITSSNTNVASIIGRYVVPSGEGTATITVTGHLEGGSTISDSVTVTIAPSLATAPDPIDINVAELNDVELTDELPQKIYRVTGIVKEWQSGKTDGTQYGNFIIQDLEDEDETMLVYGSTATESALTYSNGSWTFENPKDFLTNEVTSGIVLGDTVTMLVTRLDYGTTKELNGIITNVEKTGDVTNYEESEVVETTIAELLAGDPTAYDPATTGVGAPLFQVTGTISEWSGASEDGTPSVYGNFYLKSGDDSILVYGATATKGTQEYSNTSGYYSFSNPKNWNEHPISSALKIGDTVTVKGTFTSYKGVNQLKDCELVYDFEESETIETTVAALIETNPDDYKPDVLGKGSPLFQISGKIKEWYRGTEDGKASDYGNFIIEDDEGNSLVVYGCSATETAMSYRASSGTYRFSNPKDWNTNDATKDLEPGDTVTVKGSLSAYNGVNQLSNCVLVK